MSESKSWSRKQTFGEEIANSISHGIGVLAAIAITPLLIIDAIPRGASLVVGVSIFGATMILLYTASTLYHAFPHSKTKRVFRILDHSAIFLLIAGTYTPFALGVLPGYWGWVIFGIIWTLAVIGVVSKSVVNIGTGRLSIALYLAMGWMGVMAVNPLMANLPINGLLWLVAGGVMYSLGVIFFAIDHQYRYSHFVWHLFVLAGTACHVVSVMGYVL